MRKLVLLLLITPLFSFGQHLPINGSGKYEYAGKVVIKEDKKEIFKRLQEWLSIRKFGEPISINTQNRKTFTGKLAANNYDYIDNSECRIRGSGYVQFSPARPYMYVTFDFQLIAEDGAYSYDFKRFNVIRFVKGKSVKAHSFRVSIYSGGGGNASDAKSDTRSLEALVAQSEAKRSKIVRAQNMSDIGYFGDNMKEMIDQLNQTIKGIF